MGQNRLVKQLSVMVLAVAVSAPSIEKVMAAVFSDDAERVDIISSNDLGKHLPGGPMGVSAPVAPQHVIPNAIDMTRAIQLAVEWHPAISEAIGKLYQQNQNVIIARSGYYPQISGGLSSGYDSGLTGNGESQSFSLSMSQMLYDFGKVSSSVDSALARVSASQAGILLSIDQVTRETSFTVIELQRSQRLVALAHDQVEGVSSIAGLAKKRSEMGASTRSDLIQARARVEAAVATQLQYMAQFDRWRSALSSLLGAQSSVSVTPGFPQSLEHACQGAVPDQAITPSLLIAQAQQVDALAQIAQARAEALPTLSLDPSVTHYLDNNNSNVEGGRDRMRYGVFVNMKMPIYQGGAINARKSAAEQALRTAQAANDAARLSVRQGLLEARDQISSLTQRLSTLDFRERSISETRDLYRQQYLELGTRPLLDLLNAEQEIHQARMDRENTASDLRRLNIDCLYNTGGLRTAFHIENSAIQGVEIRP